MSGSVIDEQKIATELSQRAINRIIEFGESTIKQYWARYKNRDIRTYADYIVRKGVHVNAVRNFIYDTTSASLYDIYVPTRLDSGSKIFTANEIIQSIYVKRTEKDVRKNEARDTRAILITGSAGTGKSFFMRHAFFEIKRLDSARIPIFIELRTFNRLSLADFETRIFDDCVTIGVDIIKEQIVHGLRSGLLAVIIDGLDELKVSMQRHYEAELVAFVKRFPSCPVLVSTRPMENIRSWVDFDTFSVVPMNFQESQELVDKLEFDNSIKSKFIELMKTELFRTHYDFVSVPLLCIIMLLTYSDSGRIARNRHEFFEDAFTALWSKHDARKEGFERQRYTALEKNEFSKLLAAFAISSYLSFDYVLREVQFHRHFEMAMALSGIKCKEADFRRDLIVSTSIATEEGRYVRFCHRSFQEYFSAVFVCEAADSAVWKLVEGLSDRLVTDSVISLIFSMREAKIEKLWVIPTMEKIVGYVYEVGDDLREYAELVAGEDRPGIPEAMRKIRYIYGLKPDIETLRASYDAARAMRIGIEELMAKGQAKSNLFWRDRANFITLFEKLSAKYSGLQSALEELIGSGANDGARGTR
jgi:hypothetical protein